MKIIKNIKSLNQSLSKIRKSRFSIGFVPTMGSLHEGHLSLLQQSMLDNDITVCSIYVNPTQFNDKIDFMKYPRNIKRDQKYLEDIKCDILFLPLDNEMYPEHETKDDYSFMKCMSLLEGEKRPGHFEGVLEIVHKLFKLIAPDRAYFGEKDYQQLWLIQKFTNSINLPIKIHGCLTIRNKNGLALSSRNQRLKKEEQFIAAQLYHSMSFFVKELKAKLSNDINNRLCSTELNNLKRTTKDQLSNYVSIKLDYFEVIDTENFRFATEIETHKTYRIFIAAYISNVRLIDNILIQ